MWKKVLFVLCAALMAAAFAACGNGSGKGESEYAKAIKAENFENYEAAAAVTMDGSLIGLTGTVTMNVTLKESETVTYMKTEIVDIATSEYYIDKAGSKTYYRNDGYGWYNTDTETGGVQDMLTACSVMATIKAPESAFTKKDGGVYTATDLSATTGLNKLTLTISGDKLTKLSMTMQGMDYAVTYSNYGGVSLTLPTVSSDFELAMQPAKLDNMFLLFTMQGGSATIEIDGDKYALINGTTVVYYLVKEGDKLYSYEKVEGVWEKSETAFANWNGVPDRDVLASMKEADFELTNGKYVCKEGSLAKYAALVNSNGAALTGIELTIADGYLDTMTVSFGSSVITYRFEDYGLADITLPNVAA